MQIFIISSYKRKAFVIILLLLAWLMLYSLTSFISKDRYTYHMTIDNYLTFSYPLKFEIKEVWVNNNEPKSYISTNSNFIHSRIENYNYFQSKPGKFSFSYPSSFTLSQKQFTGSDILYHIDFESKSNGAHGFLQIWNLPYSLEDFLEHSKSQSLLNFKDFNSKPIKVNNLPGYLWDYTLASDNGTLYKGMEAFFKKDQKMYRISYFINSNLWNKEQSDIFWGIVNSLKITS